MLQSALILIFCFSIPLSSIAQTAGEIITSAIDKTGGSKWTSLNGFRIMANLDQGGVMFPLEVVQLKDGRQYSKINFQGTEIKQGVFDGNVLWSTNFQTQKPEKADKETTTNLRLDLNDFPDDLINHRKKGYSVELVGKTTMSGKSCFKIKLDKEPITVNGRTMEDVVYYYFDAESYLPVAKEFEMKHGPIQGSIMVLQFDDFRSVNGLMFPFSMTQGVKDAPPQPITVETIELNPVVDSGEFIFPG